MADKAMVIVLPYVSSEQFRDMDYELSLAGYTTISNIKWRKIRLRIVQ